MVSPHRGRWLFIVLVGFGPQLFGAGTEFRVPLLETVVVPSDEALRAVCATDRTVVACTKFVREELQCNCRKDGERWRLEPSASFVPVIYTGDMMKTHRNMPVTIHETMHVRDVAERLRAYLAELRSHEFVTESDCQTIAASVSEPANFQKVMNRFRHESNVKFQCERPK